MSSQQEPSNMSHPGTPSGSPPASISRTPDGSPPASISRTPDGSPPPTHPGTPDGSPPQSASTTVPANVWVQPASKKVVMKKARLAVADDMRNKKFDVFIRCVSTDKVSIAVANIGGNISNTIRMLQSKKIEGKCGENGFVKDGSTEILNYSNGVCRGANIMFDVVYQCQVCNPVQGMIVDCIVKNITKAGIRAELEGYDPSPVVIFIARDHHYAVKEFSAVGEGDRIQIKVVGQRFELNDTYVSVIAELDTRNMHNKNKGRKRIPNK